MQQTDASGNRFTICGQEYVLGVGDIKVLEDTTTGVLYLYVSASGDNIAVLPLIDKNGSPLLSDEN